jgi:hypothetical protein
MQWRMIILIKRKQLRMPPVASTDYVHCMHNQPIRHFKCSAIVARLTIIINRKAGGQRNHAYHTLPTHAPAQHVSCVMLMLVCCQGDKILS